MNQDGELSLKHSGYCTTRPSIEHFVGSCTVRQAALCPSDKFEIKTEIKVGRKGTIPSFH